MRAVVERDVEAFVLEYIVQQIPDLRATLNVDTVLLNGDLLDSIAVLRLVDATEQKFSIEFDSHELVAKNFQTVRSLSRLICAKADSP